VGRCTYFDAIVGDGSKSSINDKIVMDALLGVRGSAPDVRVYNLSFGDIRPLVDFPEVEQREKRLLLQDIDNFCFANDVLVVVAAGNSQPGLVPSPPYPKHLEDARWALGSWASSFNTMVCGSFVGHLATEGLVKHVGWPSPFTRIGPGICGAPTPSFGAEGGNSNAAHNSSPGLGVLGYTGDGLAEDRAGTSMAAPLLAREAALTLAGLRQFCAPGAHPFGVTGRAFLALTAQRTVRDNAVADLVNRTLGYGKASSDRLLSPTSGTAVILWQGVIENSRDLVRVQIPIPRAWLGDAEEPLLRLVVCSDPPANEAAKSLWACRKVGVTLHSSPDARAIRSTSRNHASYPLFSKEYKLAKYSPDGDEPVDSDLWILEIGYEEVFDYPPGMTIDPRQRVAIAAELIDLGVGNSDPQPAMQAMPNVASMNRLSIQAAELRNPLIIRTRR
jgi:hypothetical protein